MTSIEKSTLTMTKKRQIHEQQMTVDIWHIYAEIANTQMTHDIWDMTDENYDDDIDPHDTRPQEDATHEEEENTTQGQTNILETLIDHM